jgi:hypothetical protein
MDEQHHGMSLGKESANAAIGGSTAAERSAIVPIGQGDVPASPGVALVHSFVGGL